MSDKNIKVLGVSPFPAESPSTRYRLLQYREPLQLRNIEIIDRPFLEPSEYRRYFEHPDLFTRLHTIPKPVLRRFSDVISSAKADVVFVQREALPFGPGFFEFLYRAVSRTPMVLDIDDAIYIPYEAGRYGRIGSFLKFYGKSNRLIRTAHTVVCGGNFLADYVESKGGRAVVIPTIVDKTVFTPSERRSSLPVLGWIGTPSSFSYLKAIFPALARLSEKHRFILRLRGTGEGNIAISDVEIDNRPWSFEKEVEDFRSLDIGLYPLVENEHQSVEFIQGKSGFKAIQYMALGIPYVVSPMGVTASIGVAGRTHFEARTNDEWVEALDLLLTDRVRRLEMGERGREHFLANYDLDHWAGELAKILKQAAVGHRS
jgi:glycosyltransferase involved in cell wall biosynthesis